MSVIHYRAIPLVAFSLFAACGRSTPSPTTAPQPVVVAPTPVAKPNDYAPLEGHTYTFEQTELPTRVYMRGENGVCRNCRLLHKRITVTFGHGVAHVQTECQIRHAADMLPSADEAAEVGVGGPSATRFAEYPFTMSSSVLQFSGITGTTEVSLPFQLRDQPRTRFTASQGCGGEFDGTPANPRNRIPAQPRVVHYRVNPDGDGLQFAFAEAPDQWIALTRQR